MIRPRGPLGFVASILAIWIAGRSGALYWLSGHDAPVSAEPGKRRAAPESGVAMVSAAETLPFDTPVPVTLFASRARVMPAAQFALSGDATPFAPAMLAATSSSPASAAIVDEAAPPAPIHRMPPATGGKDSPFTGSAWAYFRAGGDRSLADAGLLGGSQAGLRLSYSIERSLALFGRFSAPIEQSRGKEVALGVALQPIRGLPVQLTAERRTALDRGGRNAFAFGLVGGVDQVRLPAGFRLDAYAQAGVVGVRSRDAYVDGSVRIERPLLAGGPVGLAAGAGVWGGAQPGASRLDAGPQLVVRVPLADRTLRLNLEWRQRVAGDARPASGAALTLATDF